ncbi:hypothetical protein [Stenotrophomonas geniculata]|uniref:hypothetical protein n=1 Tax=Stenotrophomonas geniculata TaxID=86188 RepID=UPI002E76E699|nr:hypothetical protein [Stenotrophomonas geniculata]
MSKDNFSASAQYNDFVGSAAADRADLSAADNWLKKTGLINHGELLVGYEMYVSPGLSGASGTITISTSFLLATTDEFDSFADRVKSGGNISLRKVTRDLSPVEFFSLFKRFSVTLSSNGILEGRDYSHES